MLFNKRKKVAPGIECCATVDVPADISAHVKKNTSSNAVSYYAVDKYGRPYLVNSQKEEVSV